MDDFPIWGSIGDDEFFEPGLLGAVRRRLASLHRLVLGDRGRP